MFGAKYLDGHTRAFMSSECFNGLTLLLLNIYPKDIIVGKVTCQIVQINLRKNVSTITKYTMLQLLLYLCGQISGGLSPQSDRVCVKKFVILYHCLVCNVY